MDNIKQVGKNLGRTSKVSELNKRRVSENFPQIERATDRLNPNQKYLHYFSLAAHKHDVRVNFYFDPAEKDCHPQPIDQIAEAEGDCPSFPGSDGGIGYAVYPPERFAEFGGFTTLYPSSGITVPISGYYTIQFTNGPAGVSLGSQSYLVAGIAVNGGSIAQSVYFGNPLGLAFFGPNVNINTVAYLAAGDVVAGYFNAVNIAFWTPSDICGFTGGQGTVLSLVGAV